MYKLPVVHFTTLGDLCEEYDRYRTAGTHPLIHVAPLIRSETRSGAHFPTKVLTVSVDVRAIAGFQIICYRAFEKNITINMMTQDERPSPEMRRDTAWDGAQRIVAEIRKALESAHYPSGSGIVDIGDAHPIAGKDW